MANKWRLSSLFGACLVLVVLIAPFRKFRADARLSCWSCDSKVSLHCPQMEFDTNRGVKKICEDKESCGKEIFKRKQEYVVRRGCYVHCQYLNATIFCEICKSSLCNNANITASPAIVISILSFLVNVAKFS